MSQGVTELVHFLFLPTGGGEVDITCWIPGTSVIDSRLFSVVVCCRGVFNVNTTSFKFPRPGTLLRTAAESCKVRRFNVGHRCGIKARKEKYKLFSRRERLGGGGVIVRLATFGNASRAWSSFSSSC